MPNVCEIFVEDFYYLHHQNSLLDLDKFHYLPRLKLALVLFPSFFMRYFLGAATVYVPDNVSLYELPRPPEPNW